MNEGLSAPERRTLTIDGIISYAGSLASGVVAILLVPVMLGTLGGDAYGFWIAALAVGTVVSAVDLGLGSAVSWVVAGGTDRQPAGGPARFIEAAGSLYFWIAAADAVLVAIIGFVVVAWGYTGTTGDAAVVLACCGLAAAADQVIAFSAAVLGGQRRYGTLSRIVVVTALSRSVAILIVAWSGGDLRLVALTYAAVALLNAWDAAATMKRLGGAYRLRIGPIRWSALRPYLGFGLKSFFVATMATMTWQLAPIVIGILRGTAEIPLFYAAQKFPLVVVPLSTRFSIVYFSASSRDAVERGASRVADLVVAGTRATLSIVLPYCLVVMAVAPELLHAWLGPVSEETVLILRLTSVAVIADALGATALQVLWGQGALTALLSITSVMGASIVALMMILIPGFGTSGAAATLMVTVGAAAAALLAAAARRSGTNVLDLTFRSAAGVVGPSLLAGATAWLTARALAETGWVGVGVAAVLAAVVYVPTYYFFGATKEERELLSGLSAVKGSLAERLRERGRGWPLFRSAWYFAHAIVLRQRYRPGKRPDEFTRHYAQNDPWGYETEWGADHLRVTASLLDDVRFGTVLELGCGEGFVTALLADRGQSVLATDIIPSALERARQRVGGAGNLRFATLDVMKDSKTDRYDLVVAMGLLECFSARSEFLVARRRILDMVAPDGYLLVTTTRQHPVVEGASWARWLIRGAEPTHEFLMASGRLSLCRLVRTPTHLFTLYQLTSPGQAQRPAPKPSSHEATTRS